MLMDSDRHYTIQEQSKNIELQHVTAVHVKRTPGYEENCSKMAPACYHESAEMFTI